MSESGLESIFEDSRLPTKIAEALPYSLGLKSEFEYICGDKFPELPELIENHNRNEKKWNVKIPYLWFLNFSKFLEHAWDDLFLIFVDRKKIDLEDFEHKMASGYDGVEFKKVWPKKQLEILEGALKDTRERTYGERYRYLLDETEKLFKGITKNQKTINFALTAFGAYISDLFNKRMIEIYNQGSTRGPLSWKDPVFRYQVIRPVLNDLFDAIGSQIKKIEGGDFAKGASILLRPDLALVEKKFDSSKLVNFLFYGSVGNEQLDYSDYQVIKRALIHCIKGIPKGEYQNVFDEKANEKEIDFIREVFDRADRGDIPYEKSVQILIHDPRIVDIALNSDAVKEEINIENKDRHIKKYQELARLLKQRDFLSVVYGLVNYFKFIDLPRLSYEDRIAKQKLETELYERRELFDLTGTRPVFCRKIPKVMWYLDTINSTELASKIGEEGLNDLLQHFIIKKDEYTDESIIWQEASKYSAKDFVESQGDDRGLGFDSVLSLFSCASSFYRRFEKEKEDILKITSGKISPELLGFRSGIYAGLVDEFAMHKFQRPIRRVKDLGNSVVNIELDQKIKKIRKEAVILFGVDPENEDENVLSKLRQELLQIQTYIKQDKLEELRKKISDSVHDKIKEKINENPNINVVLKDCEGLVEEEEPLKNRRTLDHYVCESMLKKYGKKLAGYKKQLPGVIRGVCSKHRAYQTDLFGLRPIIVYRGIFAGAGEGKKHSLDKFEVYSYLATRDQFDNLILSLVEECYQKLTGEENEVF